MGCNASSQRGPRERLVNDVNVHSSSRTTTPGAAAGGVGSVPRAKLVLLGDSGVGKTCLVVRYTRDSYDPNTMTTVGASFKAHETAVDANRKVRFEIWDTAGQERYKSLAPLYYRGAHAALVVFDVTSASSFEAAKQWVHELQKNAGTCGAVMLVANKTDLESQRAVPADVAQDYAAQHGLLYTEVSCVTGVGVADVFKTVGRTLLDKAVLTAVP